ncbi:hypothetical protein BT93_B0420 [Corymbia citriodora subsp. variegata]|nr:hypothetical protein BT93_B0420 [Corymbia citriodora subsp. variegata]
MKRTPFDLLVIFLAIIPLHLASPETLPSVSPTKCHEQEWSALLEFKQSLFHPELETGPLYGDPSKLKSWKVEDGDCCSWEGVECDEGTGYVTGLDLSQSCLSGPINSKASLFRLAHLQSLNLAINDFNYSQIPSAIGDLVELTSLNLSASYFAVPDAVANLSSLISLGLLSCNLQGTFPTTISELPRQQLLNLGDNPELSGHLPEFHLHNPMKSLSLWTTNFSGSLPTSLGNLAFLSKFDISQSNLSRNIPSSIGNLTQLIMLNFQDNKLSGEIPSSVGKLVQLSYLYLGMNLLSGEIPNSLIKLTNLTSLDLHGNQLTGQIPTEITGLTRLAHLDLSFNKLTGPITESISNLESLDILDLQSNNLNGILQLDVILKLQRLDMLQLSSNEFSSIIEPDMNTSLSNLSALGLASSNLSKLPIFLSSQSGLRWLDLSQNSIYGPTPLWFFNVHMSQLQFLNFSRNLITSFTAFKWQNLEIVDLKYNDIQGLLPIPPKSIECYLVSNNKLSGEISPEMCQLSSIRMLDFSKNKLSGIIPLCLDVSDNQLQGSLPRGLANCSNLEFLNFEHNQIVDTFPSWMGSLSYLNVLILRSNRFHGAVGKLEACHHLPYEYFDIWSAMKVHDAYDDGAYYYQYYFSYSYSPFPDDQGNYGYSMTIINKGILMEYERIFRYLNMIDLSSNNFIGEIPNSVGSLTELRMLNLSNNALTGSIPLSLANLTELESLDLSSNKLSGMIPPALARLSFLAFFNVSDNHLSGPIPQTNQFATFENNSYGGNLGLCEVPLTKKCGNPVEVPPAPPSGASAEELDWKIILMGFGSGLVIGMVMGLNTTSKIEHRFLRFYRGWQRRRKHQIRFV